ncbi:MAG: lysylphosphatidylglycerol synthase transmembrane domain-containing protein [Anaerolineae bacterium]
MSSTPSDSLPQRTVNWTWRIISTVIALVLIAFMLSLIEWRDFVDVLARLSPMSMAIAFMVYVLLNGFRALRFIALLNHGNLSLWRVFAIALYHNFLVRLLPFKLGEVAYIVLMRNRMGVRVEEGVSSLFGSRLLELLMIVLMGAISVLLASDLFPEGRGWALLLVVLCLIGGVLGFYYIGAILRGLTRGLVRWSDHMWLARLLDKTNQLAIEFERVRQPSIFLRALFWSCFTYSSSFAVNAILLYAIGLQLDAVTLVILVSLGMFATAFPFNISGFGAVELSWTFGLTLLVGMTPSEAASIGLMLNGFQLLSAALAGGIGYVGLQIADIKKATL